MPEFDLDHLKETWQKQPAPVVYDSPQIESMLNRSSRNYVKYILWISIAEFLIILCANMYYAFVGDDGTDFLKIVQKLGLKDVSVFENTLAQLYLGLKIISLALTATFVVLFYRNYRKISIEANLRKLILQIIRFKRTVQLFILANIILVIAFTLIVGAFTFYILSQQSVHLTHPAILGFATILAMMMGVSVLLIWVYYRLVYGFILRRLARNLRQLQKIEQEDE